MKYLQELVKNYPQLGSVAADINAAYAILVESFEKGNKLLIAGNGGSAADAEHIVGELMKNFVKKRRLSQSFIDAIKKLAPETADYLASNLQPALPAISLAGNISLNSAVINDIDANFVFAQQVYGYGKEGDVFLCLSTSGNSKNILFAAATAKAKGLKVIALTGCDGGNLKNIADVSIIVPETETYKIQELHLPVYHCLCLMLEEHFFDHGGTENTEAQRGKK